VELSAKPRTGRFIYLLVHGLMLKFFQLALAGVLFFSLLGFLGSVSRFGELSSHFRLQYFLMAGVVLIVFAGLRHWRWAAAALLCVTLNGALVVPWYFPVATQTKARETNFRVLLSNVHYSNHDYAAVRQLIEREQPDLIILQEAIAHWQQAMKWLEADYPYKRVSVDGAGLETACYSRFSFEDTNASPEQIAEIYGIAARLKTQAWQLSFVTIHPAVPTHSRGFPARNEQLALTAQLLKQMPESKMLIGDLNCSLWSPYFSRLVSDSGLKVARQGFGVVPTWPTFLPPMMIPIDHCLVSPDILVTDCRRGESIGSDHRPLIVDLRISSEIKSSN
jgi:endonuclease/exonuclease/phosphatase (EEP) superfamily protein YafD